jgi:tetratricopeptide (TPR) repeat protein
MARLKLGHTEAAIEPLRRVVARQPDNAIARFELADAHLALGRAEEAARGFEALAAQEPRLPRAWLGAGRSYAAVARRTFERLETEAPGSAYWAALIARSRASQQQYRSAVTLYRQALSRDPSLRGVHAALAEIYRTLGDSARASEEERLAAVEPPVDCAGEPLACAFLSGRYRDLLVQLADRTAPEALYWRSLAASELAREAFERLEALPPSPELHAARAEAYRIRGLHDAAIREWQAALRLSPGDRRLQAELAQTYWLNQDFEVALPLLRDAVRNDPSSARLHVALGDTLLQLQRPADAIPWLEKGMALGPDLPGGRAALARAYARAGDWTRATPHLEALLASDADGSVHVLLARAYAREGRDEEAKRLIERAQALAAASGEVEKASGEVR